MKKKIKQPLLFGALSGIVYYMMQLLFDKMETGNRVYAFLCLMVVVIMLVIGGRDIKQNYRNKKTRILFCLLLFSISAMFILSILLSYQVLTMSNWLLYFVFGAVSILCIVIIWHLKQTCQLHCHSPKNKHHQ